MTFTLSPDRMPSAIATDPRVAAHTRIGATVNATAAWSSVHSASSSTRRAILWRKNHGEEESRLARSRDMGRPRRRFLPELLQSVFQLTLSQSTRHVSDLARGDPTKIHISNSLFTRLESEHKDDQR